MAVRVEIDQDACLSAGKCISRAPDGFAFDEDELAVTLEGVDRIDEATLRRVAAECPGAAITVHIT